MRWKQLLSEKNINAFLDYRYLLAFWRYILWTYFQTIWLQLCLMITEHCHPQLDSHTVCEVWRQSIMFQVCFAISKSGQSAIIEGKINFALYERILQENIKPSVLSSASGSDSKTMNPRMQTYLQERG